MRRETTRQASRAGLNLPRLSAPLNGVAGGQASERRAPTAGLALLVVGMCNAASAAIKGERQWTEHKNPSS